MVHISVRLSWAFLTSFSNLASFLRCDLVLQSCIGFGAMDTHLVLETCSYLVSPAKHVIN